MGDWENDNIVTFLFVEKKIPGRKKITVIIILIIEKKNEKRNRSIIKL